MAFSLCAGLTVTLLVCAEFQALFEKLVNGQTTADRKAAAQDVVEQMKAGGAASFAVSTYHVLQCLICHTCAVLSPFLSVLSCVVAFRLAALLTRSR